MSVGEGRDRSVFACEDRQVRDDRRQAPLEHLAGVAQQKRVGVVGDEGARRSEVQNAAGVSSLFGEMAQVRDDVVPRLLFDLRDSCQVELGRRVPQSLEVGFADRHLRRGVALVQGILGQARVSSRGHGEVYRLAVLPTDADC